MHSLKNRYIGLEILAIITFTYLCTGYINAPPNHYTLTTKIIGRGSVTKNPNVKFYRLTEIVQLTAVAEQGWSFSSWGGDATGNENPISIKIDGDKSITATFKQNSYTLTTSVNPSSGGTITRSDYGPYNLNDIVVLTEVPSAGYTFSKWSGDGAGTGTTRRVTITGNMVISATYTPSIYTLVLNTAGSGNGSVNLNPPSGSYTYSTVVRLTANPAVGSTFTGWGGDLSGLGNQASVVIDGSKTVTATFTRNEYKLTVALNPLNSGIITKNPDQATYHYGDSVTLSQAPKTGYTFTGWSGDGVNSGVYRLVQITGNMIVTAIYTATSGGGGGGGSGSGSSGGIKIPQNYTLTLGSRDLKGANNNLGEIWCINQQNDLPFIASMKSGSYTLSYSPEANYLFNHWETFGNVTATNPQSNTTNLLVRGNGTVSAIYSPKIFEVTLESREENGTSSNLGSYSLNDTTINTGDPLNREAGNYTITFDPLNEYVFYRWETSDGVTVKDPMKNMTSLSIHGSGVLTAVYLLPRGDMKIVVEDTNGNQMQNVTVTAIRSPKQGPQLIGLTDSEGSIIFSEVVIDQYNVNVSKEGYLEKTLTVWPKMNVLVAETFSLEKQNYTLTIRVLDQSEGPLAGANVTLYGGSAGWQPLRHFTDSSGLTIFRGVYIKKYQVLAASNGYWPQSMGLMVNNSDNTYTLKLTNLGAENGVAIQPLILIGVVIVEASILIFLAWNSSYRVRVLRRLPSLSRN